MGPGPCVPEREVLRSTSRPWCRVYIYPNDKMMLAWTCVCKHPLLPSGPLIIVNAFLQRPTPTGAILLAEAPLKDRTKMDRFLWQVFVECYRRGQLGFGVLLTSPAFSWHSWALRRESRATHKKLGYVVRVCCSCNRVIQRDGPCDCLT